MTTYNSALDTIRTLKAKHGNTWETISPENAARIAIQNRFKTGLDVAKYTASIMRKDMAEYDANSVNYTQSLGCWHGFVAQQKMIAVKKHKGTTDKTYLYLSGWMVAALRSELGPLPDQSMHEKTSVPKLIEEIYTFLRQADAVELNDLFVVWMLERMCKMKLIILKPTLCLSSQILTQVLVMKKRHIF